MSQPVKAEQQKPKPNGWKRKVALICDNGDGEDVVISSDADADITMDSESRNTQYICIKFIIANSTQYIWAIFKRLLKKQLASP